MGGDSMKFKFDRKYLKISLYAFFTVAALLILHRILQSSDNVWRSVTSGVSFLFSLLSPFVAALFIAYILSPAVRGVERLLGKVFKKKPLARGRKLFSLIFVYVAVIAVISVTLSFVIPGIVRNINDLLKNWDMYRVMFNDFYNNLKLQYPLLAGPEVQNFITARLAELGSGLHLTVSSITSTVLGILSSIFSFLIALILSFYLLNESDSIVSSFNRLLQARLGEKRADSVMGFLKAVDRVFGRYISAKLLICVIMFALCFAAFGFLGMRYSVLMAAVVAITALVPYIGPIVGAIPPILISLLDAPEKAIYTLIAILAIHTVDNYFIEPYVFSDQMGLSPFWILLAIILGGGLFGLWGMLLAVPVAAVLKLVISGYIRTRQARRQAERAEETKPKG
jgi:predicted PurR-regulated permease PerM